MSDEIKLKSCGSCGKNLLESGEHKDGFQIRTCSRYDDTIDAMAYCLNDIFTVKPMSDLNIKNVIFNDPATIVFWADGTKTIAKCSEDDIFDPEKGLAMAICKRALGDKFRKTFSKWVPEEEKENKKDNAIASVYKLTEALDKALDEYDKSLEQTVAKCNELLKNLK